MNPESFLEQQDVVPLTLALNRWAQQVNVVSDRQEVLQSAGVDDTVLSNLRIDTKPNIFATTLVAAFKKYLISSQPGNYHPMVSLLQYLSELAPLYGLPEEDVALFSRLVTRGQENLKALAVRSAVARIESPQGIGIGTGVLIGTDLLLTCNHVFSKTQVQQAWVRFNYKAGSYNLPEDLLELDLDLLSSSSHPDHALVKIKGKPRQSPINPVHATLDQGQEIRLIHHPQGRYVSISDLGQIVQVGEDYLDHNLSTDEGSSGAPIFDRQWQLVAIHRGNPGIGRSIESGTMAAVPIRRISNQIAPYLS